MPRIVNPSVIQVGTGTAPVSSVAASSFSNPQQGLETITAHIQDPLDAHDASTISVVDAGAYFTSEDVEGCLQELGADSESLYDSRQNGWFRGGTTTEAGLIVTMDSNSIAIISTGRVDVSGLTVTLPNNSTTWVYVGATTGTLATNLSVPNISTVENVIVGLYTTVGGVVTSKVDGRFFVRNDNRKIPITVRADGGFVNANSEGAFMTLEAALLWVNTFVGSTVSAKTDITILGEYTIANTITISTPNVRFYGGGSANLLTGAALNPMFDVTSTEGVEFHHLTFTCNHTSSSAITGNLVTGLLVQDCSFQSDAEDWESAVYLGEANQANVIRCNIEAANTGIGIDTSNHCHIRSCTVTSTGGMNTGISIGTYGTPTSNDGSTVQDCVLEGWFGGITVAGSGSMIKKNTIRNFGLAGILVGYASQDMTIESNTIQDGSGYGVYLAGTDGNQITRKNSVVNNAIEQAGLYGIYASGLVCDTLIQGNQIDNFNGVDSPVAGGVFIGTDSGAPTDIIVDANKIFRCNNGIVLVGGRDIRSTGSLTIVNNTNVTVGNTVTIGGITLTCVAGVPGLGEFRKGVSANATASNLAAAINLVDNNLYSTVVHATVSTNVVTVYAVYPGPQGDAITLASSNITGITVSGATLEDGRLANTMNIVVSNNTIHHCSTSQTGTSTTDIFTYGCMGIGMVYASNIQVTGNIIHDIGIDVDDAGVPFQPTDLGPDIYSFGVLTVNSSLYSVSNNTIYNLASTGSGVSQGIAHNQISSDVEPTFDFTSNGVQIKDNTISWVKAGDFLLVNGVNGENGIALRATLGSDPSSSKQRMQGFQVTGNQIASVLQSGIATTIGDSSNLTLADYSGNQIIDAQEGIAFTVLDVAVAGLTSTLSQVTVDHNQITNMTGTGILFDGTMVNGTGSIFDIKVSENSIQNTLGNGIDFNAVSGFDVNDIYIDENNCRINGTDTGSTSAIRIGLTDHSTGTGNNFRIIGNTVYGPQDRSSVAIALSMQDSGLANVAIERNHIGVKDLAVGGGIGLRVFGTGPDSLSRVQIMDNNIMTDLSCLLIYTSGEVSDLTVNSNLLTTSDGASSLASPSRPFYFRLANTGIDTTVNQGIVIADNILRHGDGCRIESMGSVAITALNVTGNIFLETEQSNDPVLDGNPDGFYAGLSIYAEGGAGGDTSPLIRDIVIANNTFQDNLREGLSISTGASTDVRNLTNVVVDTNTFTGCSSASDTNSTLHIYATKYMQKIQVSRNTFTECTPTNTSDTMVNTAAVLLLYTSAAAEEIQIGGNQFSSCTSTANSALGSICAAGCIFILSFQGIEDVCMQGNTAHNNIANANSATNGSAAFFMAVVSSSFANNLIVTHNTASDCTINAESHLTEGAQASILWTVSDVGYTNFVYTDNTVDSCSMNANKNGGSSQEYPNTFFIRTNLLKNGVISRNRIANCSFSGTDSSDYETALHIVSGSILNTEVDHNHVHNNNSKGLLIDASDVDALSIRNNQFWTDPVVASNGISLICADSSQNVWIESNYFDGYTTLELNFAISLSAFRFERNQYRGAGDAISFFLDAQNGTTYGEWSFQDNQLVCASGKGLVLAVANGTAAQSSTLRQVQVGRNQIESSSNPIDITTTRVDVYSLDVSNNQLRVTSSDHHGISLSNLSGSSVGDTDKGFYGLSLCQNDIQEYGGDATSDYAGIRIYGPHQTGDTSLRDLVVMGNNITTSRNHSIGLLVDDVLGGQRGVAIQSNNIAFTSGGAQTGMSFTSTTGGGSSWTILGNNVRGATTTALSGGVTYNYIIVAHNTSNSVANWGTWTSSIGAASNQTFTPNQA